MSSASTRRCRLGVGNGSLSERNLRATADIPIGREGAPEGYTGFGGGDLLDPVCSKVISLARQKNKSSPPSEQTHKTAALLTVFDTTIRYQMVPKSGARSKTNAPVAAKHVREEFYTCRERAACSN